MNKQQRTNLLHLHVLIFSLPPGLSCTGHKATLMPGVLECKGLTLNCQLLPSFISSSLKLPWNRWQNVNGLPKCLLFRPLMKFSIFIFQPHKPNIKLKHLNLKKVSFCVISFGIRAEGVYLWNRFYLSALICSTCWCVASWPVYQRPSWRVAHRQHHHCSATVWLFPCFWRDFSGWCCKVRVPLNTYRDHITVNASEIFIIHLAWHSRRTWHGSWSHASNYGTARAHFTGQ